MNNSIYPPNLHFNPFGSNGMQEEEINYKSLIYKYLLSKWYLYFIGLAIGIGLARFYVNNTQPTYKASSKILIKERSKHYDDFNDDWLRRNLISYSLSENVSNEIEVLKAYSLMYDVVEDLGLDTKYYWKKPFSTFEAYEGFPIEADTFSLYKRKSKTFDIVPINQDSFTFSEKEYIGTYKFGKLFKNEFGAFQISKTRKEIKTDAEQILRIECVGIGSMAGKMLKNLEVNFADAQKNSSILEIKLEDPVPSRAVDVLNKLIEKYNTLRKQKNNAIAVNTLDFIDDRLKTISQELDDVEYNVEQYKLNNDIASESTSDLEFLLGNVGQLNNEQRNLSAQIRIVKSMKKDLNVEDQNFELIPLNLSLTNTQILDLIRPYNELVLKREQLLLSSQPSNPVVIGVDQELINLKSSIYTALENMEDDLQLKLNAANTQYNTIRKRLRSMPSKERDLLDKSRQQTITEDLYVYLLRKKEETALALVSNYSESNIVDAPRQSSKKVSPNEFLIYFGGAMGGLAIPFILILSLDLFKDQIQSEHDLKKMMPEANIMGMISYHKGKEKQVVLRQKRALTAEHFRSLRTSLQFFQKNQQQSILVTSTSSEEGKTFIATNLAISFALAKKKTIIVDFDLHKPEIAKYLEETPELGLSNYLSETASIEEIIQASKGMPNLDYIASGPVLSTPSELITAEKLNELFSFLKTYYDVIIIDSAPLGIISDAILLGDHITNSLFVVRAGMTKKETIDKAREIIEKDLLVNPSILLNGVKKTKSYQKRYKAYV